MQLSQGSKWIWANNCPYDKNCYCEFADKFIVNNPNAGAYIRICADNRYVLWVNSRFIGLGQYTDYPDRAIFDTLDISDFIIAGENTLRILVYFNGTPSPTYSHNIPGLIFDVISENKTLAVSSSRTASRVLSEYNKSIGNVYTFPNWYFFSYDATKRALNPWQSSFIVSNNLKLSPSPVETFKIKKRTDSAIINHGNFFIKKRTDSAIINHRNFFYHGAKGSVYKSDGKCHPHPLNARTPFNIELPPEILPDADGTHITIDLGTEVSGFFEIDIVAAAGTRILIELEHKINYYAGEIICSAGRNKYVNYINPFKCRYITLYIESFDFTLFYAGLRTFGYDVKIRSAFNCSDSLHNKIFDSCMKSLTNNAYEHYGDSSLRHRVINATESRSQLLAWYYAVGEYDKPRENLRMASFCLRPDGLLEVNATVKFPYTYPCFSLIWILELYEYVLYSDDLAFALEMWPCTEKIIRTFWRNTKGHDLQAPFTDEIYRNFYDDSHGLSESFLKNLRNKNNYKNYDGPLSVYYILALDCAVKLTKLLYSYCRNAQIASSSLQEIDFMEKLSWCEMLLSGAKKALHKTFWDSSVGAYCTYIINGEKIHFSELMNSLVLYAGLVPDKLTKRVTALLSGNEVCVPALIPVSLDNSIFKYEALLNSDTNYADYVLNDIADKWGNIIYKADEIDSVIPLIIYFKYVLGISPRSVGFKDYNFKPVKQKTLLSATGKVPRIDRASLDIEINENGFKLT